MEGRRLLRASLFLQATSNQDFTGGVSSVEEHGHDVGGPRPNPPGAYCRPVRTFVSECVGSIFDVFHLENHGGIHAEGRALKVTRHAASEANLHFVADAVPDKDAFHVHLSHENRNNKRPRSMHCGCGQIVLLTSAQV